jgi:Periplasmic copper-binding protein (NosD)
MFMRTTQQLLSAMLCMICTTKAFACTEITTLPFPISQSGSYCLAANLSTSAVNGIQISIVASDVELDLAGHSLRCSVASQNAISASTGTTMSNIRVHGGAIIGCNFALSLRNCSGCAVQDLRLLNNAVGISISGDGARVERNQIRNDLGSGGRPAIQLDAYSSVVQDNLVSGSAFGLDVNGKDNLIRSNHFASCANAIRFFTPATYQDNLARCNSNFSGAALASSVDAGGNK